jgi:hypothetical protein
MNELWIINGGGTRESTCCIATNCITQSLHHPSIHPSIQAYIQVPIHSFPPSLTPIPFYSPIQYHHHHHHSTHKILPQSSHALRLALRHARCCACTVLPRGQMIRSTTTSPRNMAEVKLKLIPDSRILTSQRHTEGQGARTTQPGSCDAIHRPWNANVRSHPPSTAIARLAFIHPPTSPARG